MLEGGVVRDAKQMSRGGGGFANIQDQCDQGESGRQGSIGSEVGQGVRDDMEWRPRTLLTSVPEHEESLRDSREAWKRQQVLWT